MARVPAILPMVHHTDGGPCGQNRASPSRANASRQAILPTPPRDARARDFSRRILAVGVRPGIHQRYFGVDRPVAQTLLQGDELYQLVGALDDGAPFCRARAAEAGRVSFSAAAASFSNGTRSFRDAPSFTERSNTKF